MNDKLHPNVSSNKKAIRKSLTKNDKSKEAKFPDKNCETLQCADSKISRPFNNVNNSNNHKGNDDQIKKVIFFVSLFDFRLKFKIKKVEILKFQESNIFLAKDE